MQFSEFFLSALDLKSNDAVSDSAENIVAPHRFVMDNEGIDLPSMRAEYADQWIDPLRRRRKRRKIAPVWMGTELTPL